MIAQILAMSRRGLAPACRNPGADDSRAAEFAARSVQVALAIALIPALATMLVVGGIGAAAVGAASVAARTFGGERRPPSR